MLQLYFNVAPSTVKRRFSILPSQVDGPLEMLQHIEVIQKIVYVNKETGFSVVILHYPAFPDFKDLNVFAFKCT